MNKLNPFANFLFILFYAAPAICQQKAHVQIQFPATIKDKTIDINFFGNGSSYDAKHKTIHLQPNQNQINIDDSFYVPFAVVQVVLKSKTDTAYKAFYIWNASGNILFKSSDLTQYQLTNAYSLNTLGIEYDKEVAQEWKDFEKFQDTLRKNPDSVNRERNTDIINNISFKTRNFIRLHNTNPYEVYYNFELFVNNEAGNQFVSPDTLLNFFETTFPDSLKNSAQGKLARDKIYGLVIANASSADKMQSPDFITTDISGKPIKLKDELSKGIVLINFWATWCQPCVAELPAIEKIHETYPALKIISVSGDRDSSKFTEALKKYKMDWINVYRDFSLADKFGISKGWPQLFLINKNEEIIYNRSRDENDWINLAMLNSIIKQNIE